MIDLSKIKVVLAALGVVVVTTQGAFATGDFTFTAPTLPTFTEFATATGWTAPILGGLIAGALGLWGIVRVAKFVKGWLGAAVTGR